METDIKFTNTNSFSIRCGKCADIHNAQLDGKTTKSCECDCHEQAPHVCPSLPYQPYNPPYNPWVDPPSPIWYGDGTAVNNRPFKGYTTCSTHWASKK